ncbi:MAG TPA: sulfur carrier protein ThiS [Solirubrobacteraceae bacterium]|jgi:sulfur carrier protein|nr:sulfur carrier protein ThiS [Solirubrobacteraceae bacterium]
MIVTLNGQPRELPDDASVGTVVSLLGSAGGRGVAVALDGEVVPRGAWSRTPVREGDQVEVVAAIQGG